MIQSMTGYASRQGTGLGYRWSWELRSVNGKGLDLRLRVPDWIDGLEPALRKGLGKAAARGNVFLSLRVYKEDTEGAVQLNPVQLDTVLAAMAEAETRAMAQGLSLAPSTAADVVAIRGVLDQAADSSDTSALCKLLAAELPELVEEFRTMRRTEGDALRKVLEGQISEIAGITEAAQALLQTRAEDMADNLKRNLEKVLGTAGDMEEGRLAQELALIAVKSDVTEEIDRLQTHVAAARRLLKEGGAVGRKLDFLAQEFNREANTLCSKAQMPALTEKGLALKVVIDQMREQIQNVE